jgi:hypothetical protein
MSGNAFSYFSKNITSNNNNISNRNTSLNTKYPLKMPNYEMMLKLPKINISKNPIVESNISAEEIFQNKIEDDINHLYKISKINSYRKRQFNKHNKKSGSKNKITNNIFKNKILSDLNDSSKPSLKKLQRKNISLISEPIILKENFKNSKKENYSNFTKYNNSEANLQNDKKKQIVNEYVSILINEDSDKKKEMYSTCNNEKDQIKYSLDKSIDPTKYIKNKFLDESFNSNIFRTSKEQLENFNGNEHLRKINIKRINANNMNHYNIQSLQTESNNKRAKSLINQMLDFQKPNFYFGKRKISPKYTKIKNKNIVNFEDYLRKRRKERNGDDILTFDEKINNAILGTKDMRNDLIENRKNRIKIMNKIRQYCDNLNGMVRKESIMRNNINKIALK